MIRTQSQMIDDVLAGTFPASDSPAWTPGMARPTPNVVARPDVNDESGSTRSERTFANGIMSLIGAAGLAMLVPFAIIVVWTVMALALHGLLEAAAWLLR